MAETPDLMPFGEPCSLARLSVRMLRLYDVPGFLRQTVEAGYLLWAE